MTFKFRTHFGEDIFNSKYRNVDGGCGTWPELAKVLANRVCGKYLPQTVITAIEQIIVDMKFIPAGRYLYYAGREASFFSNCFAFIAEDSREGWAELGYQHFMALMAGGGCGTCYDKIRPSGSIIGKTGGQASGPLPLMFAMNEVGRNVMQGGSRRSALYASLNWKHTDIESFIMSKNWTKRQRAAKAKDFNYNVPLDMTNISVNLDDNWLEAINDESHGDCKYANKVFNLVVSRMVKTAEPGFSFNFGEHSKQVGRNACSEYVSEHDSSMCNLGSVNISQIDSPAEMLRVSHLASMFLACGSLEGELPYQKCYDVREKDRAIGLGVMGVHEFLTVAGGKYEMTDKLRSFLEEWRTGSETGANEVVQLTGCTPVLRYRSVAPAGTISILAGTTSGIEPLYAVGLKRRYLRDNRWRYQYIIDPTAKYLIDELGVDPYKIETSIDLSMDPERRVAFQTAIQEYTDMAISSTLNLQAWGTEYNNKQTLPEFIRIFKEYAPKLRGITCYPDGARGGQPLTSVPYHEALEGVGVEHDEMEEFLTTISCPSGTCSI